MKTINVKLKNCYGITELNHVFDFNKSNSILVYAPNGVMKTSFAKTFLRISNGLNPEEKLFNRVPEHEVISDTAEIDKNRIMVIRPFDKEYESKNVSTLLVNSEKKTKYDTAIKSILDSKQKLVIKLNKLSKIKKDDIESSISADLECSDLFKSIERLQSLHNAGSIVNFSDVKYAELFDEKVISLLSDPDIQPRIAEYTNRYNELLAKSPIYRKGTFNPSNADTVAKTLKKENFFKADHKITLNGQQDSLASADDLDKILSEERAKIIQDQKLVDLHNKIVSGVAAVKTFQAILESTPEISAHLGDLNALKTKIWLSYYNSTQTEFDELLETYNSNKDELIAIENEALLEETLWHKAKETFKQRFHVPFGIDVENHKNAILGTSAPNIVFSFEAELGEHKRFNRGQLDSLDILSTGERRALYLLYIIFELTALKSRPDPSLVIIDDIADSFDYKNKYAIIEYLRELNQSDKLRFIVMTHNFDFYRTYQSRVLDAAKWDNSFVAQKTSTSILLQSGGNRDVTDPFELWRKKFHTDSAVLVSMIPFVRNLIEYKHGTSSSGYMHLTSMLHIKNDTNTFKLSNLVDIIKSTVSTNPDQLSHDPNVTVLDFIFQTADSIASSPDLNEIRLENKIALSIACRLLAEQYMWDHVDDKSEIKGSQTGKLYDRYYKEHSNFEQNNTIKILGQTILMTPENIHLNSFMYEPIVDMSIHHLKELYASLKSLNNAI